ncbi:hypothetical protein LTR64_004139 [Lithohypha guttulata]|uniref:Uncharacterized protein n=1 Tax=Lithohypha guttulata TaxID=1690604 RepID=A0AAN7T518_9EURO|nr:hypothetical protein LTR51_006568 [Lithohypha guttulata]KAK5088778.1 hypothetical protein LTR05_003000 [Lithohypha guttulata]
MNGTLRGLPTLSDVHIPPLRNPGSGSGSRNARGLLPLELVDYNHLNDHDQTNLLSVHNDENSGSRLTRSAPLESPSSQAKKPHLAISELVDAPSEHDNTQVQLPSFVSLSVVEKSPTPAQLNINGHEYPHKRPRLEAETDRNRLLPRPIQKDDKQGLPLLPAMVTGLHEPPPSAALLPSMDPDARPSLQRTSTSKMQVRDMLQKPEKSSNNRPPEQMLNTPELMTAELPKSNELDEAVADADTPSTTASLTHTAQLPKKDTKVRRTRRKWSEPETSDLLAGVKKHGFGKWKQILNDPAYTFVDRTSIDLKDRFRVFAKDYPDGQSEAATSEDALAENSEVGVDSASGRSASISMPVNRQRRKRHPWTKEEDSALLLGVRKYGFQWTDIHNDHDLDLNHRRATDLRDRIRNLYPDGYKHAEARPLRAEVKKQEKAGKKETPAGTLYAPPSQMDSITFPSSANSAGVGPATENDSTSPAHTAERRQTTSGKFPSIAQLTTQTEENDSVTTTRPLPRRSKIVADIESNGITLPSLALNETSANEEWDNTLPPFVNWEHDI